MLLFILLQPSIQVKNFHILTLPYFVLALIALVDAVVSVIYDFKLLLPYLNLIKALNLV